MEVLAGAVASIFLDDRTAAVVDQLYFDRKLDEIRRELSDINIKLDEETWTRLRTGVQHLADALTSSDPDVRLDELRSGRKYFAQLSNLSPDGHTQSAKGAIPNIYLIGLGHWGSMNYFILRGDDVNAALQAYRFTLTSPLLGTILFPGGLFSRSYRSLLTATTAQIGQLQAELQALTSQNSTAVLLHNCKQVGRILGVIGAGIGGTVAGGLLPIGPGPILGAVAFRAAMQGMQVKPPELRSTSHIAKDLQKKTRRLRGLLGALEKECRERIADLMATREKDLLPG